MDASSSSYHDDEVFTYPFDLQYEDYTDFTNPFDPSHHNFIKPNEPKPSSTFKVDDLDIFIGEGGDTTTQALLNLPLTLFLDILSTLSITSLAICRCVCKTWGTIIHHPRFTNLHVQKPQHPITESSILFHVSASLIGFTDKKPIFSEIHLVEHGKGGSFRKGGMRKPQFMPATTQPNCFDFKFEVIGSCNGLLCLGEPFYYDPIYVCNPVIGEYMILPSWRKKLNFEIVSGIGFDQVANEYKVVRMIYNYRDFDCSARMEAEVCTLGSNKWRNLGEFRFPNLHKSFQVFVNGAIHWMAVEDTSTELIAAFDVGKEEFRFVQLSDTLNSEKPDILVGELGGNLCVVAYTCDDWCQVWVMKEYGVKDSWEIKCVISRNISSLTGVNLEPVKLTKNGNILFVVNGDSVMCYNPRKKRFRKRKISLPPRSGVITHVGSFIFLKDFVAPADREKHCINTGGWYGVMKSVTSCNPEFDIDGWKLNEKLRRLWLENF